MKRIPILTIFIFIFLFWLKCRSSTNERKTVHIKTLGIKIFFFIIILSTREWKFKIRMYKKIEYRRASIKYYTLKTALTYCLVYIKAFTRKKGGRGGFINKMIENKMRA